MCQVCVCVCEEGGGGGNACVDINVKTGMKGFVTAEISVWEVRV